MQKRRTWRRLAGQARSAVYRIATLVDRIARWRRDALVPPAHLRVYYYRTWSPTAFTRAGSGADRIDHSWPSTGAPGSRHRIRNWQSRDQSSRLSPWWLRRCRHSPRSRRVVPTGDHPKAPEFSVSSCRCGSRAYNPHGLVPASAYRFPCRDQSFDFIFLASVFTHMLPDAVEHYLHEISRLLVPDGVCVASYFLLNHETRSGVDQGHSFIDLQRATPVRIVPVA